MKTRYLLAAIALIGILLFVALAYLNSYPSNLAPAGGMAPRPDVAVDKGPHLGFPCDLDKCSGMEDTSLDLGPNNDLVRLPPTIPQSDSGTVAIIDKPFDAHEVDDRLTSSTDPDKVVEKTVESVAQMMALGEAVKKLPEGDVVIDPPARMTVGDSRIVTAVVGVEVPKADLESSVSPTNTDSQLVEGKLKVGYRMSADLVGTSFKIERISDEVQEVAIGIPAQWQWKVEAKAEGQNLLKVALYAHMPKLKGTVPITVKTFSRVVSVKVRPQTWGEWANSLKEGVQTATGLWKAIVGFAALAFGGVYGSTLLRGFKALWARMTARGRTNRVS
ncbi:hypothetical protein EHS39_23890 [Ensifer sp. MPMI2T]|nr:hypothetical protein EHS39_23890 [Ensifer sp. MPMI2T]